MSSKSHGPLRSSQTVELRNPTASWALNFTAKTMTYHDQSSIYWWPSPACSAKVKLSLQKRENDQLAGFLIVHVPSCSINCQQNPSIVGVSSSHPPRFWGKYGRADCSYSWRNMMAGEATSWWMRGNKKNDSIITANLIIFPQSLMISRIYNGNMGNQPGIRAGKVKLHFLSKVVVKYSNIHKYQWRIVWISTFSPP